MTSLANALLPSSLGRLGRGPETGDATLANRVGHPGNQGRLRADDDQVHPQLGGQGSDPLTVQQTPWQLAAQRDGVDAGIAGCSNDGIDRRVERQRPDDGVLASTGANHEYLHGR